MNIQQMQAAIAVADHLSFTEAAYSIDFSTSSISRLVMDLEKELGVRLFDRNGRTKVSLTEEGLQLMPYLRNVVSMNEQLLRAADNIRSKGGTLALVCPPNFPAYIELDTLSSFMQQNPDTKIIEYRLYPREGLDYVLSGKADIGFATVFGAMDRDETFARLAGDERLISYPIVSQSGKVLVNKSHPLAAYEAISLQDFKKHPDLELVGSNASGTQFDMILEKCTELGIHVKSKKLNLYTSSAAELLNSYIQKNPNAITVIQDILVRNSDCAKVPFHEDGLNYMAFVYYLRKNQSHSLKSFIRCVKDAGSEGAWI